MRKSSRLLIEPYRDIGTLPIIRQGEAIDSLPEKIRLAVILYYVEDYSIKEIKGILHIPEGTVKSRLNKGRSLLKEYLEK